MTKPLSDRCIRASWEVERTAIRNFLLEKKRFNSHRVDKFIDTYIDSMVFAKLPCTSKAGVIAAARQYAREVHE